ncbi:MAG: hypothetical protein WC723_07160, partial [Candidatus Omnitrophota bacterium]
WLTTVAWPFIAAITWAGIKAWIITHDLLLTAIVSVISIGLGIISLIRGHKAAGITFILLGILGLFTAADFYYGWDLIVKAIDLVTTVVAFTRAWLIETAWPWILYRLTHKSYLGIKIIGLILGAITTYEGINLSKTGNKVMGYVFVAAGALLIAGGIFQIAGHYLQISLLSWAGVVMSGLGITEILLALSLKAQATYVNGNRAYEVMSFTLGMGFLTSSILVATGYLMGLEILPVLGVFALLSAAIGLLGLLLKNNSNQKEIITVTSLLPLLLAMVVLAWFGAISWQPVLMLLTELAIVLVIALALTIPTLTLEKLNNVYRVLIKTIKAIIVIALIAAMLTAGVIAVVLYAPTYLPESVVIFVAEAINSMFSTITPAITLALDKVIPYLAIVIAYINAHSFGYINLIITRMLAAQIIIVTAGLLPLLTYIVVTATVAAVNTIINIISPIISKRYVIAAIFILSILSTATLLMVFYLPSFIPDAATYVPTFINNLVVLVTDHTITSRAVNYLTSIALFNVYISIDAQLLAHTALIYLVSLPAIIVIARMLSYPVVKFLKGATYILTGIVRVIIKVAILPFRRTQKASKLATQTKPASSSAATLLPVNTAIVSPKFSSFASTSVTPLRTIQRGFTSGLAPPSAAAGTNSIFRTLRISLYSVLLAVTVAIAAGIKEASRIAVIGFVNTHIFDLSGIKTIEAIATFLGINSAFIVYAVIAIAAVIILTNIVVALDSIFLAIRGIVRNRIVKTKSPSNNSDSALPLTVSSAASVISKTLKLTIMAIVFITVPAATLIIGLTLLISARKAANKDKLTKSTDDKNVEISFNPDSVSLAATLTATVAIAAGIKEASRMAVINFINNNLYNVSGLNFIKSTADLLFGINPAFIAYAVIAIAAVVVAVITVIALKVTLSMLRGMNKIRAISSSAPAMVTTTPALASSSAARLAKVAAVTLIVATLVIAAVIAVSYIYPALP